jgi:hypothetical protein
MTTEPHTVTTDELLDLIAHERRRAVVRRLIEADDGRASVAELVPETGGEPGPTERDIRVRIELHHHHLPKLERAGVVEYDPRNGDVRYRPDPRLERLVRFVSAEL